MLKRTLGNTGLEVTQLGYGTMGLRGPKTWGVRVVEEHEADQILNKVLDAGINFIDTSPDYGIAEERIGRYLSSRRDEFILATKCGCCPIQHADHLEVKHEWKAEVLKQNLETSLKRMQTDHIDLLQFHGGDAETLQREGLLETVQTFREQGKIRFIGMSNSLPHLPELIDLDFFDTFQMPYSCLSPEHEACLTQAAEQGAGIIIRGGIAKGGPDAEIQRENLNAVWEQANLNELLDNDQSRAELILRYTLSHPHCQTTIVGTCDAAHLQENLASAEKGPLPADLSAEITQRVNRCIADK